MIERKYWAEGHRVERSAQFSGSERLRRVPPTYRTGSRLYTARDQRYPSRVRPAHQATARIALLPIGVPSSSPRSVLMTGVKGWYSANQRTPPDIESGRTNALLMNDRSWKMRERLLAPAGVLPTRPNATDIHVSAKVNSAMMPSAASQATGFAVGRKPMSSATPRTRPH